MNLLGHLYLSGPDNETKVGNFMGDWVKGRAYLSYPAGIQKGILLHRAIDSFTDHHDATRQACRLFQPAYSKYAGIVVDIVYDYFLAHHWHNYSDVPLDDFSQASYRILGQHITIMPLALQRFLPVITANKRLESYAGFDGIETVLRRMPLQTSLPNKWEAGMEVLRQNEELINELFIGFIGEHKASIRKKFGIETFGVL